MSEVKKTWVVVYENGGGWNVGHQECPTEEAANWYASGLRVFGGDECYAFVLQFPLAERVLAWLKSDDEASAATAQAEYVNESVKRGDGVPDE